MKRLSIMVVLLAALFLGSCAVSMKLVVNPDDSGILAVDARIPYSVASRLQAFRSVGTATSEDSAPFFDVQSIRNETELRGIKPLVAETPSPNSFRGSFSIRSLTKVMGDPELSKARLVRLETHEGESTLSFSLSRENAEVSPALFPGIDPNILETLSPPALDPYPATASEYQEMLLALLGEAAMKELETAEVYIQVIIPGSITRSSGGIAADRTFTARLRLLDLLILEKPIEFSVSWK